MYLGKLDREWDGISCLIANGVNLINVVNHIASDSSPRVEQPTNFHPIKKDKVNDDRLRLNSSNIGMLKHMVRS
jgi:hypothetical protein